VVHFDVAGYVHRERNRFHQPKEGPIQRSAILSPCRRWRYRLDRRWTSGQTVCFIGLNPSTADETTDDPTLRRCIGFASKWGYGSLFMVNLYALRATDPSLLWQKPHKTRVGPHWQQHFLDAVTQTDCVVTCWGGFSKGRVMDRRQGQRHADHTLALLHTNNIEFSHLGLTRGHQPKHPLYLAKDTPLSKWCWRPESDSLA